MAVKGDLAYQGLEDLLQANLAAQGGGRLTLRHGAQYAALVLDEAGLYVAQPDLLTPRLLIEAFAARGRLNPEVAARSRSHGTRALDHLIAQGALDEGELLEVLAAEVEDTILDMLLWEEGGYRFENKPFEPGSLGLLGRICVDPVGVAERALARIEQRREIASVLGDHALLFEAVAGELPPLLHPADRIHEIYARLDGQSVIHEIALHTGLSRFEALEIVARLARAGLARPVGAEGLARAASRRADEGRHPVARALVIQWVELAPQDPAPLQKLASLGQDAGDREAELEALCALGRLYLQQGDPDQALGIFTRAMRHAPADDVVLAGLRLAAEASGNHDALVDGTLLTAQSKLDEGEADAALEILEPMAQAHPTNMAVHLLRARALVQSEKRSEFFAQAEVVGQVLSRAGCRSETDREVVEFFRETIAHLAPDRGDLLEQFRTLYDPRRRRRRNVALVGALVLLLCGAAVFWWPASPTSLLERAQEAAAVGDKALALEMIGQLVDKHPDSVEAETAYRLQAQLFPPASVPTRTQQALAELKQDFLGKVPALIEALAALPDPAGQATARMFYDALTESQAKTLRTPILDLVQVPLHEHARRLQELVIQRVQTLAETAGAHEKYSTDAMALREFIDEATRMRDPTWMTEVKSTAELLYGLAKLHGDRALITRMQELAQAAAGLDQAAGYYDQHIVRIRLALAHHEVEAADRRCREDAPRLMVSGDLDQADACYARMEALLERYGADEVYARLLESLQRRQLPQMLRDRRAQIADIRARLAAAQTAEDGGDLAKAVALYTALVKEYWLIRFENVCTLPLRVVTTPPGAHVSIAGRDLGPSPVIVRYAWGGETTVHISAPGFTAVDLPLRTAEERPASEVRVALEPAALWSVPSVARGAAQPLDLHGDVLIAERRGVLTRLAAATGDALWTADLSSLEGIRARPALAGDSIYVARVDGRVYFVDPGTGASLGHIDLPRTTGNVAALGSLAAVATTTGHLVLMENRKELRREELPAVPTAGVVAAHGAFWVGTADGSVVRVAPAQGNRRLIECTRGTATIVEIAPTNEGLLVTTSDGALIALDPNGDTRWRQAAIGDLRGTPASCAGVVAVVDRAGVLHTFDATDGTPLREPPIGGSPAHGVVAAGEAFLVARASGELHAFDARKGTALAATTSLGDAAFALTPIGSEHVVASGPDGSVLLLATPRKP